MRISNKLLSLFDARFKVEIRIRDAETPTDADLDERASLLRRIAGANGSEAQWREYVRLYSLQHELQAIGEAV